MAEGKRKHKRKQGKRGSKASPGRLLAREVCAQVRKRDAYVRELLDGCRDGCGLSAEDFDFAQVLAFGVTMCAGTLDEAIDRSLSSPKDIKPKVRDCLRISAYELLFLHKPAHAVVDQGVELVRSVAPKAAGLANAVLHKMVDDAQGFPWGDIEREDRAFARVYGMPTWLAVRLVEQYGHEQAAQLLSACLEPAPTYLCDNPLDPKRPFASDLSAQQVAALVPLEGMLLEVGAGRGTKTVLLQCRALSTLGRFVGIHTVDVHAFKERLLSERLAEMGIDSVMTHTGDARALDAVEGLPASFDVAFVDAPCSGMGTLRRHPEIRWHLTPEDVEELVILQLDLLCAAAARVRPGGALVYATCSILREENEGVVSAFLSSTAGEGFVLDPIAPDELIAEQPGWRITDDGCFAALPTSDGPDGHFAARLRRVG